ncbi:MAG: hypothetical protein IJS39_14265 [Synergistaceae bacterium]|nr:hypothetical protein [Synergistaceae bacterium]
MKEAAGNFSAPSAKFRVMFAGNCWKPVDINPIMKEAAGKSFALSVNFRVMFAEVAGNLWHIPHHEGGSREFFCTVSGFSGLLFAGNCWKPVDINPIMKETAGKFSALSASFRGCCLRKLPEMYSKRPPSRKNRQGNFLLIG